MGGGVSSEDKRSAMSEEAKRALAVFEGLSEEAKREITAFARTEMEEVPPAAVEISTPRATAPAVDEKNAALVAQAAEKVAKAESLRLEKDDEEWRKQDGTAFESALQVDPEHGVSPVKLIDMRFIIALGELGGTMVRRQDLPKEAFIDLDTLKRLKGDGGFALPIISISHPWQQPDHPDPKEVNLQLLAKVMKIMLYDYKQDGVGTFAVFFE